MSKQQNRLLKAAAALSCVAAPFGIEAIRRRCERRRYPPTGFFVEVGGRKMHVYTEGDGQKTLVFLPGLGTASPIYDFMPLLARLRGQFRCVVPEPFGYGFSDLTSAPRTALNIVAEIREGLLAAGFKPPYVLFGHSIAGIYMLTWAAHYPSEVEAVIGDDTSVPMQVEDPVLNRPLRCTGLLRLLNRCGALRLYNRMPAVSKRLEHMGSGDPARCAAVRSLAGRNTANRSILDEALRVTQNCRAAQRLHFPKACRLLHLVAQSNVDSLPDGVQLDWLAEHQKQTLSVNEGRCVVLPGEHYLHWTQADAMAREIRAFLAAPQPAAPVSKVRRFTPGRKS